MKTPLKNILAVIAGDAGSRIIGFAVTVYLARILSPSSFGLMNVGMAVLGYLSLLGSPGIQLVETRNAAAAEGGLPVRAGAVLSLRLALVPLLIALTWIVVVVAGVQEKSREIVIFYAVSLVPMALSLDWLFQGKEDFRTIMASRLLNGLVFAVCVVILVRGDADVALTAAAFLAGNAAAALLLGVLYRRRYGHMRIAWDLPLWRGLLRENVSVGAAVFLAQSVTNLPPIVIAMVLSNADVGLYSAAMKLVFVLLLIDRTLNALFLPLATRYAVTRPTDLSLLLSAVFAAIVLVMVPALIVSCIIAPPVVLLVFGPGYLGAVPLFRALTGYILVTLLNSVFVCTLMAFGRTREYSRIVGSGSLVLCISVIVLTLLLGSIGAVAGILVGETVILWMMARAAVRVTALPSLRSMAKPAWAGAAMALAALLSTDLPPLTALVISLAVFVVVLLLTRGVPLREIRFLRERLA